MIERTPPVGSEVLFEGHAYRIVSHTPQGTSELLPIHRNMATFKGVTCVTADLYQTEEGEYQTLVKRDADDLAEFYARQQGNTATAQDKRDYADHLVRKLSRSTTTKPPCVIPNRTLIRGRHWDEQRNKGE